LLLRSSLENWKRQCWAIFFDTAYC